MAVARNGQMAPLPPFPLLSSHVERHDTDTETPSVLKSR